MFSKLGILKQNVIFLFIGSKELYFIRFIKGKIFSTRSYKTTYSTEHDSIKTFFKDYFIGKEGIPVCIIYDIPNQIFTEYKFLKSINAQAVHQSIIKKITQEALVKYARSVCSSNQESALFLGLDIAHLEMLESEFNLKGDDLVSTWKEE